MAAQIPDSRPFYTGDFHPHAEHLVISGSCGSGLRVHDLRKCSPRSTTIPPYGVGVVLNYDVRSLPYPPEERLEEGTVVTGVSINSEGERLELGCAYD